VTGDEITLLVGGRKYSGWESARVTRSMESISGSFALAVSERWAGQDQSWPIREGDEVTVQVNGVPLVTGHLDDRDPEFDANSGSISITGRDKTGDLVDSSVLLDHWSFKNFSPLDLAKQICRPFGISVRLQDGLILPATSLSKKLDIDPGDKAATALEHVCRAAAVLPMSDGVGGLVLVRSSTARCKTELVQGKNILSGKARFSHANRFHRYLVLGQHKGNDDFSGEDSAAVKGEATDPNVRSSRVLVIRPEGNLTRAQAQKRAEWEAAHRAARGDAVSVKVQGWTHSTGALWPINEVTRVRSARLGINGDMLISQATYSADRIGGRVTELELRRPGAFQPQPSVASEGDGLWKEIRRGSLT